MSQTPQTANKPDALRDIYRDAVASDRGPSAQSTEAILARARQQAAVLRQQALQAQQVLQKPEISSQPAANDRHWLRHALGSLAAVGLVGWLMLQHSAWWDGSDAGIGAGPAAEAPAMAHTGSDEPPVAADAVPADAAAEVSAEAAAPVQPPVAAAPRASHQDRPAAISKQRESAEAPLANRPAIPPSTEGAAAAKLQKQEELPLCPLPSEASAAGTAEAETAVKSQAQTVPNCRPRKPAPAHKQPAPDAAQEIAPADH